MQQIEGRLFCVALETLDALGILDTTMMLFITHLMHIIRKLYSRQQYGYNNYMDIVEQLDEYAVNLIVSQTR